MGESREKFSCPKGTIFPEIFPALERVDLAGSLSMCPVNPLHDSHSGVIKSSAIFSDDFRDCLGRMVYFLSSISYSLFLCIIEYPAVLSMCCWIFLLLIAIAARIGIVRFYQLYVAYFMAVKPCLDMVTMSSVKSKFNVEREMDSESSTFQSDVDQSTHLMSQISASCGDETRNCIKPEELLHPSLALAHFPISHEENEDFSIVSSELSSIFGMKVGLTSKEFYNDARNSSEHQTSFKVPQLEERSEDSVS